jgi:RND superfamily putative drug exporter
MASVFFGFVLGDPNSKLFGLTLSVAILLDAFIIRLIVIPSLMTILGGANWWLPGWLDRVIPHFAIETDDEEFATESALIEDVPDSGDDVDPDKKLAGSR